MTKPKDYSRLWDRGVITSCTNGATDQHVMPTFPGEREHEASIECWCKPIKDTESIGYIFTWIHNRIPAA